MINTTNGMLSTSSASGNSQSPGLKTYFKTPEGRYKLHYEKTHPSGLLHYAHGKTVTQVLHFHSYFNHYPFCQIVFYELLLGYLFNIFGVLVSTHLLKLCVFMSAFDFNFFMLRFYTIYT